MVIPGMRICAEAQHALNLKSGLDERHT